MFRSNSARKENKPTRKNKADVYSLRQHFIEFIKSNKLIIKWQQIFRINKAALNPNDDEKIQSISSIATYGFGRSKDLVCKKEEIKYNNIIKQYKNY